jgi:very-short-patch-repair endonuclease
MMTGDRWWDEPPPGQASYLADVDPALLNIAVDPLPPGAPAVIRFRPAPARQVGQYVTEFLDALDGAALDLFPRWLAGAERLDGASALSVAAVRSLAAGLASRSLHFGPFLAATAERALLRRAGTDRFPLEVRARGLCAILAEAYQRPSVAVLADVPDGLDADGERALVAAAIWLAEQGRFTVWLAGRLSLAVERIPVVKLALPDQLVQLVAGSPAGDLPPPPVLTFPPLSGLPRADSAAEQALERALAPHDWARGRQWNQVLEWHLLGRAYRLDLYWPDDGLVVEVDGDDHRERWKYADDRHRDARLQLLGHDVLRFTNDQVLTDPQAAALTIRDLLALRRSPLSAK